MARAALPADDLAAFRVRAALALALACAAGLITIDAGFVFDDHRAIEQNPVVIGAVPAPQAFVRDFWGKPLTDGDVVSYRPLTALLWRSLWALGAAPLPFHVMGLLLHVAAVAALLFAGVRLGCDRKLLGTAALIFAVHATHAEAVGGNVSHADLASAALGLCALGLAPAAHTFGRGVLLAAMILIAALFKETALTFAAAAAAVVLCADRPLRGRLITLAPLLAASGAVLAIQLALQRGSDPRYSMTLAHDAHGLEKLALGLAFFARGAVINFVPIGLAPKHSYAAWDLSAETLLPHAIPGALLLVVSAVAVYQAAKQRNGLVLAVLALLLGPIVMNTGLLVQVPNELPERTFYPATMAASGLLAAMLLRIEGLRVQRAALAALVIALFAQRYRAQRPWHDELALWSHALEVEPKSAELHMFMAHAQEEIGHADAALYHAAVTAYIATQRPRRVNWDEVETLDALPLAERWRAAPRILWRENPCGFALGTLAALHRELPSLEARALQGYRQRYAACFALLRRGEERGQ